MQSKPSDVFKIHFNIILTFFLSLSPTKPCTQVSLPPTRAPPPPPNSTNLAAGHYTIFTLIRSLPLSQTEISSSAPYFQSLWACLQVSNPYKTAGNTSAVHFALHVPRHANCSLQNAGRIIHVGAHEQSLSHDPGLRFHVQLSIRCCGITVMCMLLPLCALYIQQCACYCRCVPCTYNKPLPMYFPVYPCGSTHSATSPHNPKSCRPT
jgi:hypothetical protein